MPMAEPSPSLCPSVKTKRHGYAENGSGYVYAILAGERRTGKETRAKPQ